MTQLKNYLFCILAICLCAQLRAGQPSDGGIELAQRRDVETGLAGKSPANKQDGVGDDELLRWVGESQPKLASLLKFMKQKQAGQYQQAVKELTRVKLRLAQLEKRDEELYHVEYDLWIVRSKMRLIAAEMAVADVEAKDQLHEQMVTLAAKEYEADVRRLEIERARAVEKLELIKSQLSERKDDREAFINKSLKAWESRINKPRSAKSKTEG